MYSLWHVPESFYKINFFRAIWKWATTVRSYICYYIIHTHTYIRSRTPSPYMNAKNVVSNNRTRKESTTKGKRRHHKNIRTADKLDGKGGNTKAGECLTDWRHTWIIIKINANMGHATELWPTNGLSPSGLPFRDSRRKLWK